MNWSSPKDLRTQVQNLWDKGELLRAWVAQHSGDGDDGGTGDTNTTSLAWPLRLSLKTPTSADLSERFDAVRLWVQALDKTPHIRIEWRELKHRVQGNQRLPAAVWLDQLDSALAWIGQNQQVQHFAALWQQTQGQPALLPWLQQRPLKALALAPHWRRLLAVTAWLQAHPRPGVYLRQVDIPGVDSKFIEAHRSVLGDWLDLSLPPEAIASECTGVAQFNRRYGFREKPSHIRFRNLDPTLLSLPGCPPLLDLSLEAGAFARLKLPVQRVFITENEANFLTFPLQPAAMVIFGAGYGWEALAQAHWLHDKEIHYWGDIDTHGFAILNQLRRHFPLVRSLLMDQATLLAHRPHWTEEPQPSTAQLLHLSPEESALYDALRQHHFQERLRLEQERVSYGCLERALAGL